METGVTIKGIFYRPGRAAALFLKMGRTTLYRSLRAQGYLSRDNYVTKKGKDIGIINYDRGTCPSWADYTPAPYFSDDAISFLKDLI